MTQTAKTLTLIILTLIAGVIIGAGISSLSRTLTEEPAPVVVSNQVAGQTPATTAPAAAQLGEVEGTERMTPAQALEAEYTADRVCEGKTAGEPIVMLEQDVADASGMSLPDAHDFVERTLLTRCVTG